MEELPWTVGKDRARRRARGWGGGRSAGGGEAAQRRALLGLRRTRPLLPRLPPRKRARLLLRLPLLRAPRRQQPLILEAVLIDSPSPDKSPASTLGVWQSAQQSASLSSAYSESRCNLATTPA